MINYTTISLDISEDLADGNIIVTQTGGVFDSRSPITISLQPKEMKIGFIRICPVRIWSKISKWLYL